MCGRFSVNIGRDVLIKRYKVSEDRIDQDNVFNNFNVAPSNLVATIINENRVILSTMKWGFIPNWSNASNYNLINTRSESILEKTTFRKALQRNRCIIPVTGFYEWKKFNKTKIPYYIYMDDLRESSSIFSLAAIYSISKFNSLNTFSILTTNANPTIDVLHSRMPVIIDPNNENKWLSTDSDMNEIIKLMVPYSGDLKYHPVSSAVNTPYNNTEECILPVELDNKLQSENNQPSLEDFF